MTTDREEWMLTPRERGNPATLLDSRHADGAAWSAGNEVRPLVHGAVYFAELYAGICQLRAGDLLMFTDWRGDPDQRLDGPDSEVARVLCEAAQRGVIVKGLVWRSHLDSLQFSGAENRHLGEEVEEAGGEVLLDMRVRPGGSHHQKFVVLRHKDRPELDVAYVGGIDLCHSRRDDAEHKGDPQAMPMPSVYGDNPPWHDLMVAVRGPAVGDVEAVFRERWEDPEPLSRSPLRRLRSLLEREDTYADPLPDQLPDPAPRGPHTVQLLRTYPARRHGFSFAPDGERSIARGYRKVLKKAESLIYVEDQYFWSPQVAEPFAEALAARPELRLVAVIPLHPDQDGRFSQPPNMVGHREALGLLYDAAGDRVAVYGLENHAGTPIYVHAKTCIVDDVWATVGSDNFNRRSWTHDSELGCAVIDETGAYARDLRLTLAREHLDRAEDDDKDLHDHGTFFTAFANTAAALDSWHEEGGKGPRPQGRLRRYETPEISRFTRAWASPLYRAFYDPDGRPAAMRRANTY